MKAKHYLWAIILLLCLSTASAQLSVQHKRTIPGIAKEQSGQLVFDIINSDMSHQIEGILECESPDDAVVGSGYDEGSGGRAQYYPSPKFIMLEGPSLNAIALYVSADSPGDKRVECTIMYLPYKVTEEEDQDIKQYLLITEEYIGEEEITLSHYRELRFDKTVLFAPEGVTDDDGIKWEYLIGIIAGIVIVIVVFMLGKAIGRKKK